MSEQRRGSVEPATVGIIANPAAGKDVRRLVAQASTVDNQEKVRIVRRVLAGLAATGVQRVYYMADSFGIVPRAAEGRTRPPTVEPIPLSYTFTAADSERATAWLDEHGITCVVTLGGDGTNRMVARGSRALPLLPIATGTNNVFPFLVDGTIAGLAAGLYATGRLDHHCLRRLPCLEVWIDGTLADLALIDVAVSRERFLGARAIWDPRTVRQIVVSRIVPGVIGLAAVAAALFPDTDSHGAIIELGGDGAAATVPLAPGLVTSVPVRQWSPLALGDTVVIEEVPCTVALDGERELRVHEAQRVTVRLSPEGPLVLDPRAALAEAARRQCLLVPCPHP
ncbi:MAG: NAD(+)/NADH kinase [Thermomicrobium sp.]|nr:NAD(+)/NADH kinase [Thermomicrobium sp.]MDW7982810.1 NAD(+)/NADH kinase [Thermomicrobium sp.]MDW8060624.1 NAD(+)/NADH kinase [Thermomicrobium sp.]